MSNISFCCPEKVNFVPVKSSSSVYSSQFPMGAGGDGPLGGMAGMEPHHMNGSLGTGISSLHSFYCIDSKSLF